MAEPRSNYRRSRSDTFAHRDRPIRPAHEVRRDASPWHWLLWVPIVVPLVPFLYNDLEPRLIGLPFYYWIQLAFAGLASAVIAVVHIATKDR